MSDTKEKGVNSGVEELKGEGLSQVSGGSGLHKGSHFLLADGSADASLGLGGDTKLEAVAKSAPIF